MATKKKAKKSARKRKMTAAEKAAFVKKMAAARKASKRKTNSGSKRKPATKKAAKKAARKGNRGGTSKAEFLKRMAAGKAKAAKKGARKSAKKRKAATKRTQNTAKRTGTKRPAGRSTRRPKGSKARSSKSAKAFKHAHRVNKGRKSTQRVQAMSKAAARRVGRKKNDGDAAAIAEYNRFHGRDPDVVITGSNDVHEHERFAGLGKLWELAVLGVNGEPIELSHFRGAVLCSDVKGKQLYIKGGDQKVDLDEFDIGTPHESELLGFLVAVSYETTKDHLTPEDGGHAIYEHVFEEPLPALVYDVRNKLLSIVGGSYELLDVGIHK